MDDYSRGFRDGAAAACEATADKLREALREVGEPGAGLMTMESVHGIFRLLIRQQTKLAAQVAAVSDPRDEGDSDASNEGEGSD